MTMMHIRAAMTMEMSAMTGWMENITATATTTMVSVRTTSISCMTTKRRTVFTSDVQRCTRSPVLTCLW